jgi:hypothetical protein
MKPLFVLGMLLAALATAPAAAAATYYVSPSGSDANPGTLARPWRTLAKAAATIPAGADVAIRGGTYAGFEVRRGGLPGDPTRFYAHAGETVVVDGASGGSNAIDVRGARYLRLEGLTVQHAVGRYNAGIMIRDRASDVAVVGSTLRWNQSYGIRVYDADWTELRGNEVYGNDSGIRWDHVRTGSGASGNRVHDNDGMVVNTPCAQNCHDDTGGAAFVYYRTTGPIHVQGNEIYGHHARSYDYGPEGAAHEIFAASNVDISGNRMWNNQTVLETGTNGGTPCSGNRFTGNGAWGDADDADGVDAGLILRCAANMVVSGNRFRAIDWWLYDVNRRGGFAGAVQGLRITGNRSEQFGVKVYSLDAPGVTVDGNADVVHGGIEYASVNGERVFTLERLRQLGYQRTGSLVRR